jgi:hypothetical protein
MNINQRVIAQIEEKRTHRDISERMTRLRNDALLHYSLLMMNLGEDIRHVYSPVVWALKILIPRRYQD